MRSSIFWDTTSFILVKDNPRFGGIYRFHLQDQKVSKAINQHEPGKKHSGFLHDLFIDVQNGGDIFFRNIP
jgi:hypothetical protein